MTHQPTLFDNPPTMTAAARQSDPITSHLAAERVESTGNATHQRGIVLSYVQRHSGQTSAEIANGLNVPRHMPARRLPELRKAGMIRNGEKRLCSVAGTLAMTWESTR